MFLNVNTWWYFKDISQPYFKEIHDIVYIFVIEKCGFLKKKKAWDHLHLYPPFVCFLFLFGKLFCTGFIINL